MVQRVQQLLIGRVASYLDDAMSTIHVGRGPSAQWQEFEAGLVVVRLVMIWSTGRSGWLVVWEFEY